MTPADDAWKRYELHPAADLSEVSLKWAVETLQDRAKLKTESLILEVSVLDLLSATEVVAWWNSRERTPMLTIRASRIGPRNAWALYAFDDYVYSQGA